MFMQLFGVSLALEASSRQRLAAMIWRLPKAALVTGLVAVIAAFSALSAAAPASADAMRPSFLRSVETRSTNLSQFTRWNAVLSRFAEEAVRVEHAACRSGAAACSYKEWLQFLHRLHRTSKWEQLVAVNNYMNARPYVADDKNWGIEDYWATPGEFLVRSGDCEDFAVAKFLSLKQLGWTDDELRIAAVKDRKLGVGHAVLVAYFGGKVWLLDNQLEHVTDLDTVRHYEPVYSINESHWWLHKKNERPQGLVLTVGTQFAR
jgi:predicted transglutaminase-like cysteine proteinase